MNYRQYLKHCKKVNETPMFINGGFCFVPEKEYKRIVGIQKVGRHGKNRAKAKKYERKRKIYFLAKQKAKEQEEKEYFLAKQKAKEQEEKEYFPMFRGKGLYCAVVKGE